MKGFDDDNVTWLEVVTHGEHFENEPHRHATLDDLRAVLATLSAEQLESVIPEQFPLQGVK